MSLLLLLLVLGASVLTTGLAIPSIRRWAIARDWVDRPDGERKLHHKPVPAVGGIAIAGGAVAGIIVLIAIEPILGLSLSLPPAGFWVGALLLFCVGVIDDRVGINFKAKLLFQVIAAYLLIHAGIRVDLSGIPFFAGDGFHEALYAIPLTLLWVVGVVNAVNLIDGIDGLAGGVVIIAFVAAAAVFGLHGNIALVAFAIPFAGAVLGFLYHNFNPASVFMGDSGSLVLGFVLAAFTLQAPMHADPLVSLAIPVVVLGLPIIDTGLSVLRRLFERKAICAPDHDHIHHRLSRLGSVRSAVMVLYAASAWFALAAILMSASIPVYAAIVLGLTAVTAVFALRTLGYLHVRDSIAQWKMATAASSEMTEETAPSTISASDESRTPTVRLYREVEARREGARPGVDFSSVNAEEPAASAA